MQDYGLVSIITPTWGCASFISESIKCIQSQTYTNWELLIQDDCSTDGTDKVVQEFLVSEVQDTQRTKGDPRIKYECNVQNSGMLLSLVTMLSAERKDDGLPSWIQTICGSRRSLKNS